jgi:uncharacterized protein (DUF2384 family)
VSPQEKVACGGDQEQSGRIQTLGRRIFASDAAFAQWLRTEAPALHGARPIDLMVRDDGFREVEALLQGIAHGNVI